MDYDSGKCEAKSEHQAAKVTHLTQKKYIIQRWYYYTNFSNLGQRLAESELPLRTENTPRVSCDDTDNGSCRLYDEWNLDHLVDNQKGI